MTTSTVINDTYYQRKSFSDTWQMLLSYLQLNSHNNDTVNQCDKQFLSPPHNNNLRDSFRRQTRKVCPPFINWVRHTHRDSQISYNRTFPVERIKYFGDGGKLTQTAVFRAKLSRPGLIFGNVVRTCRKCGPNVTTKSVFPLVNHFVGGQKFSVHVYVFRPFQNW